MNGSIPTSGGAAAAFLLLAACATAPEAQRTELAATLTGQQSAPEAGDLAGTGTATVRVDPGAPRVCWDLFVRGIAPATAAHIHRGMAGTSGPPVVTLTAPGPDGRSEGCADVTGELATEINLRPYDYYINVHNAQYPGGAIRGQLRARTLIRER